jgi:hypothetical protein
MGSRKSDDVGGSSTEVLLDAASSATQLGSRPELIEGANPVRRRGMPIDAVPVCRDHVKSVRE